jgi:hypothetical protein
MGEHPTCTATAKSGERCRVPFGLSVDGLCSVHDPARTGLMRDALAKSVEVRQQKRILAKTILPDGMLSPPKTLNDAVRWSAWAMHAAVTGAIDARTAHEVGFLVNSFTASLQKRDLQRTIDKLRAELAEAKKEHARPRIA